MQARWISSKALGFTDPLKTGKRLTSQNGPQNPQQKGDPRHELHATSRLQMPCARRGRKTGHESRHAREKSRPRQTSDQNHGKRAGGNRKQETEVTPKKGREEHSKIAKLLKNGVPKESQKTDTDKANDSLLRARAWTRKHNRKWQNQPAQPKHSTYHVRNEPLTLQQSTQQPPLYVDFDL